MTFEVPAHGGKPASRIRQKNEETIIKAAEAVTGSKAPA